MMLRNLLTSAATVLLLSHSSLAAEPPPALGSSLEDFYSAALDYNPGLDIAREQWNVQTARKQANNGRLLPQISLTGSKSKNKSTDSSGNREYDGKRYGIQLQQVLFNWQTFSARGKAALQEDQAQARYYAQLAQLLTDVADRYLKVLQSEDALRSINAEVDALNDQVTQLERLFERQLIQITELYDAKARLAGGQSQKVVAESELAIARAGLSALSNLETGALYSLPADARLPELSGDLDSWLEKARANNHMIASYNYALRAADKQVSERKGAFMPNVTLVMQQQNSNLGFDNLSRDEYDSTYIGVNVSMPLFAGGSNNASYREAQSLRNIASSELRQARLDVLERARTAYLQANSGQARIFAAEALLDSTVSAYTAMQRGFELGSVTSVDLLNALRDRFNAERELQAARYEYIRAFLYLHREAGELGSDDLMQIGRLLEPVQ